MSRKEVAYVYRFEDNSLHCTGTLEVEASFLKLNTYFSFLFIQPKQKQ